MSVKLITFLEIFSKFLPFLGLMPGYDFNKMELIYVKQYKIYCTFLSVFSIFVWIENFSPQFRLSDNTLLTHFLVLFLMNFCNILTYNLTILGTAFWNRNCWLRLLNKSINLETNWNLNTVRWYKNSVFLIFIFCNMGLLYGSLMNYQVFPRDVDVFYGYTIFYFLLVYFYYVQFVQNFIIYHISINIRYKYNNLSKTFTSACSNQVKYNNRNFGKTVRKFSKTYRKINEIIDEFNQLFGWQILSSLIIVGVVILSLLNAIFAYESGLKLESVKLNKTIIAANIITTIIYFVSLQFFGKLLKITVL